MTRRGRFALFAVAVTGFAALLVWGTSGIPDFGHYQGRYGKILEKAPVKERQASNAVAAIVFDYRGLDTMGEEFILFAAVSGVVLLLRSDEEEDEGRAEVRSDALRLFGAIAAGVGVLVGLWLIAFGLVTPGGGFQGGVVV